jgi:uncharacterized protein
MPRAGGGRKLEDRTSNAEDQVDFRRGVEEFNAGKFFEAHETWEAIWLKAPEPDKTFLQGITQVTAAFHHFSRGNPEGTASLLRKGLEKLERFPINHRGVQLDALRMELRVWVTTLGHAQEKPALKIPHIEWSR